MPKLNIFRRVAVGAVRSLTWQQAWAADIISFGHVSNAGKTVTPETAATLTAVFASWRIISDGVSTLPADTFTRYPDGVRKPYRPRPAWLDDPNPALCLSRIDVLSQILLSLLSDGNAYVATYRAPDGTVLALEVLDPKAVTPERTPDGVRYRIGQALLGPFDVLHIPGMLMPGQVKGMDPIRYARDSIGLSLAAQEYGATFFRNGALPASIVEVPGSMSETGIKMLRAQWQEMFGGSGNANKLGVLTEGAKFSTVSLAPDQAQFLQTRQFGVAEVARIYGVPPHLLADASGSTSWGSGLAEQNLAFIQHTLRPWIERIEAALTWLLQSEGRPPRTFVKLNVDGLQRGSFTQRWNVYALMVRHRLVTPNEIRAWEDLPPLPDGDTFPPIPGVIEVPGPDGGDTPPEPTPNEHEEV